MAFDPQLTLADLLNAETDRDLIVSEILTALGAVGFPVTNWEDGASLLTLAEADAAQFADTNATVAALAAAGFVTLAPGNPNNDAVPSVRTDKTWLDLVAFSWFSEVRQPAVFGQYAVKLTVGSGRGPYTIAPNGLHVTDSTGAFRYTSTNPSPVMIDSTNGPSNTITFQADQTGSAYNAIDGVGISLIMTTFLLGVTAATVAAPGTPSSSIITAGSDFEYDAKLSLRCTTKWATLTVAVVADSMVNYALNVFKNNTITSVFIDAQNPDGPGTFRVYLAGPAGAVSNPDKNTVDAVLQKKKPLTSTLTTLSATNSVLSITGTVFGPSAQITQIQQDVLAAIANLQALMQISDGSGPPNGGTFFLSVVYDAIQNVANVRNVDLTTPAADTTPAKGFIVKLTNGLVFTGI